MPLQPEGSSQHSAAGKAKAAADWAAKGAGSVASAAKTAVTGSNEANEDQTPAGKMQTRCVNLRDVRSYLR